MHTLERLFQKHSSIVSRRIADEVILVPIRRRLGEVECLYTLNEVGARIWELIDGTRRVEEIRDLIVSSSPAVSCAIAIETVAIHLTCRLPFPFHFSFTRPRAGVRFGGNSLVQALLFRKSVWPEVLLL